MYNSCSTTRTIALRMMIFVLTASVGQGLVHLFKGARTDSFRVRDRMEFRPSSTPVSVENLPIIEFPTSLLSIRSVDFWVPSSMVVEADGTVRDLHVDMEKAVNAEGSMFYDELLSKANGKRAVEITNEVIEALTNELTEAKFKPRTFRGQTLPTMVFVHSHFRTSGACWTVETEFRTSEGEFWSVFMQSGEPCKDSKVSIRQETKAMVSQ